MSLQVLWDGEFVGRLVRVGERTRDYAFHRDGAGARRISLSLAPDVTTYSPAESRPFFEALLPEGAVRDQIAQELRLAAGDSYGLLAALGRDCPGALQIVETRRLSEPASVRWLEVEELHALVAELPRRPLGVRASDGRVRLSLAGVQHKAVLVRDHGGRFGEPEHGLASTHILKPGFDETFPGLAINEYFCMRLAAEAGLEVAKVELITAADRPCLVVERFDRDTSVWPARRLHQEDLCQALGLTPDFKYQHPDWTVPSYAALGELLDRHGTRPGVDRLAVARSCVFNVLVGNADAHAKNHAILHGANGVRFAPLYDIVSTAAYPDLAREMALSVGDEFDPRAITLAHWHDLARDLGLQPRAFAAVCDRMAREVPPLAVRLADDARRDGWGHEVLDTIVAVIATRAQRILT